MQAASAQASSLLYVLSGPPGTETALGATVHGPFILPPCSETKGADSGLYQTALLHYNLSLGERYPQDSNSSSVHPVYSISGSVVV